MALFDFPNPVNEKAPRVVAGAVVVLSAVTLVLSITVGHAWLWLIAPIAYGFVARLASGPRFSLLGQFATRVAAPRLGEPKLVAGPPKRFAQGIGAAVTVSALVCHAVGADLAAQILLGVIIVAAALESVFALCLGCHAFSLLMRAGVVPESVCLECADVSGRISARLAQTGA